MKSTNDADVRTLSSGHRFGLAGLAFGAGAAASCLATMSSVRRVERCAYQ